MSYAWVKNSVPGPVKERLRPVRSAFKRNKPGFVLTRMPVAGELIASMAPVAATPILVTSLPRSGSSWIGRIIGRSENALYLREPLTQSYLNRVGPGNVTFFEWGLCKDPVAYDRFAELAFHGIPRFARPIVPYPGQWAISRRHRKRPVVKEVNPLVIERLWARYQPKIVLLLRHPAAVARSYHALGWTKDRMRARFMPDTLTAFGRGRAPAEDFWEQAGAFQAIAQNLVARSLDGIDHLVARYEDVCADPMSEFGRIFEYCGLPFSGSIRREIERTSRAEPASYAPGNYDTVRHSVDMADRWRSELDPRNVDRVRQAYFACRPLFYRDDDDW